MNSRMDSSDLPENPQGQTGYSDPQDIQDRHGPQGKHRKQSKSLVGDRDSPDENELYARYCEEFRSGTTPTLNLTDYVCCAARYQVTEYRDHDEVWNSDLWHFTRSLKSHPVLIGSSADEGYEAILAVTEDWEGPNSIWIHQLDLFEESVELEFLTTWAKIRFRSGQTPLSNAVVWAEEYPLLPSRCEGGRWRLYAQFVSIAGWLQVTMGDRNIMLPIDLLSPILNCSGKHVSRLRQLAVMDRFLTKVVDHVYQSSGGGKATEFRFDTSRFYELDEAFSG